MLQPFSSPILSTRARPVSSNSTVTTHVTIPDAFLTSVEFSALNTLAVEALICHPDPAIALFARGELNTENFRDLSTKQIKIIVIACLQHKQLHLLTFLFKNGANTDVDLSEPPGGALPLSSNEVKHLLGWITSTGLLTSLNLRNHGIDGDLAAKIVDTVNQQDQLKAIKLSNHPLWVGATLSHESADVIDLFLPVLFHRFGPTVIAATDAYFSAQSLSSGEPFRNVHFCVPTNGANTKEIALYLHLCSHILNLVQHITANKNLPDLKDTLHNIGKTKSNLPHISVVITAHPTRLSHPDFAIQKTLILNLVSKINKTSNHEPIFENLMAELTIAIVSFCQIPALRDQKPSVGQEHDELLVDTYPTLQNAVKHVVRRLDYENSQPIRLRTWATGDHDGHNGITPHILIQAAIKRSNLILSDYLTRLCKLETSLNKLHFFHTKATLSACTLIDSTKQRISTTLHEIKQISTVNSNCLRYHSAQELLLDLNRISIQLHQDPKQLYLAKKTLANLQTRVSTFGLHYASVDLRQNSSVFEKIVSHFYAVDNYLLQTHSYENLDEIQRVNYLTALIRKRDEFDNFDSDSSSPHVVHQEIALLHAALKIQKAICSEAIGYQIIANTESQSDLLEVVVTLIAAGGYDTKTGQLAFPVVPLFETLEDLRQCHQIMSDTFSTYQQLGILLTNNTQPIMIGYSDSNKDGGIFASRIAVSDAIVKLKLVADKFNHHLVFFHGNGASEARGGGDLGQTIKSRNVISDTTELTIQGEATNHLFASRQSAAVNLAELVAANHCRLTKTTCMNDVLAEHLRILTFLAETSERHYRQFHDSRAFSLVFFALNDLLPANLTYPGSRPASRSLSKPDLFSVRAITHNIPTTVTRMMFQAIFGVGTALNLFIREHPDNLLKLQQLYDSSLQFKSIIDDIESALAKANPAIAQRFLSLLPNELQPESKEFFLQWNTEYLLTRQHLLAITGQERLQENKPVNRALLVERIAIADVASGLLLLQLAAKAPPTEVAVTISTVINALGAI